MITITAFKWVPEFAQGQVRDHRVRWILNEVEWDYQVDLIDNEIQRSSAYRTEQPFGQVPVLREKGRATLFETGAIVLSVAERAGKILPKSQDDRALCVSWIFAAVNSLEPFLMNLAELDFFTKDQNLVQNRRPTVLAALNQRLSDLSISLGERMYLVGDEFTAADLMVSSVLKILKHTDVLEQFPNLKSYQQRCFERPAYKKAIQDQLNDFKAHSMKDMKYKN